MIHYISSDDDTSGSGGRWKTVMHIPAEHNRIALMSACVPKSFYVLDSTNASITIGGTVYPLNPGNYSASTLKTELNRACTPHVFSFNVSKSKYTLTSSGTTSVTCSAHIARLLGFPVGTTAYTTSYEGYRVCNVTRSNQVYVNCDVVQDTSNVFGNCLHTFYMNDSNDMAFYIYDNPNTELCAKTLLTYVPFSNPGLIIPTVVNFIICDVLETILDFNGPGVELIVRTWKDEPLYDLVKRLGDAWVMLEKERRVRQDQTGMSM